MDGLRWSSSICFFSLFYVDVRSFFPFLPSMTSSFLIAPWRVPTDKTTRKAETCCLRYTLQSVPIFLLYLDAALPINVFQNLVIMSTILRLCVYFFQFLINKVHHMPGHGQSRTYMLIGCHRLYFQDNRFIKVFKHLNKYVYFDVLTTQN